MLRPVLYEQVVKKNCRIRKINLNHIIGDFYGDEQAYLKALEKEDI